MLSPNSFFYHFRGNPANDFVYCARHLFPLDQPSEVLYIFQVRTKTNYTVVLRVFVITLPWIYQPARPTEIKCRRTMAFFVVLRFVYFVFWSYCPATVVHVLSAFVNEQQRQHQLSFLTITIRLYSTEDRSTRTAACASFCLTTTNTE